MKRLIILLLSILISFSLSAVELAKGTLDFQLSLKNISWGIVTIEDEGGTPYTEDNLIALSRETGSDTATGKAYLNFFVIGTKLNIKVVCAALKYTSESLYEEDQTIDYTVDFTNQSDWQGGDFSSEINTNSTDTNYAVAPSRGKDVKTLCTSGTCQMSINTESVSGKGMTKADKLYYGTIKVVLEST